MISEEEYENFIPQKLIGLLIGFIYKIYGSTWRYEVNFKHEEDRKIFFEDLYKLEPHPDSNCLYSFWHQDELCLIKYFSEKNINILISKSKDGWIINGLAEYLGYLPIRGSTNRRRLAGFIEAMKKARAGHKISMSVDGPKGPIYKVKDGLPAISTKYNKKIAPMRAYITQAWISHKSWNKIRIPWPCAKINILVGKIDVYDKDGLEKEMLSLG